MPARVTHNFSDEHALLERWHTAGKRYLSFTGSVIATSEVDIILIMNRLASILSPDDRFAVDLYKLRTRETEKSVSIHGYVFKHCRVDDHAFLLDSLEETEIDEIVGVLDTTPWIRFGATELVSTAVRGGPIIKRRFSRRKKPSLL